MKRYGAIYADPPWEERGGGCRGANHHYDLMKTKDIMAMGPAIRDLRMEDAHLWMWAVNPRMDEAVDVLRAWGAHQVSMLTWSKLGAPGLGQYSRGLTEHLLLARWGQPPYRESDDPLPDDHPDFLLRRKDGRHQFLTLVEAPRGRHSEKPECFRQLVEWMSHGPYLELFSRKSAEGWDVWGNEVEVEGSQFDGLKCLFSKHEQLVMEDLF